MRPLLAALPLLAFLAACGAPSATPGEIRARGELVVGTEAEFWPFEYATPSGEYVGFDMDLARMIADDLGVKLRIENMSFTGLVPALLEGKIDLILSGMTATEERAKTISFTAPYYHTGLCLLLNRDSTGGVESWRDLDDPKWTIAVKTGTTGDFAVQEKMPRAKRVSYPKEVDCAQVVASGRADAFVYDQASVLKHQKANPDTTRAILKPFTEEPYAMGVRQGDTELRAYLDAFLAKIREDGRYDELMRKHLAEVVDEGE